MWIKNETMNAMAQTQCASNKDLLETLKGCASNPIAPSGNVSCFADMLVQDCETLHVNLQRLSGRLEPVLLMEDRPSDVAQACKELTPTCALSQQLKTLHEVITAAVRHIEYLSERIQL